MADILTMVTAAATSVISLAGDVATEIVSTPVLALFAIAIPLCGIGVSMFKRLINVN